ncbi:MAG: c-type cytochrome [Aeromonadales bacterium]|nr:c-type cytochrome [Aeromonadales bacterium]
MRRTKLLVIIFIAILLLLSGWIVASHYQQQQASPTISNSGQVSGAPSIAKSLEDPLAAESYRGVARSEDNLGIVLLVAAGQDHIWGCTACHGNEGEGTKNIPRLAGLPAGYITKQLHDFVAQRRLNANMQYVASGLTDQQMAAIGEHYSKMESTTAATPRLGGDLKRGRELALQGDWSLDIPACFSCHGSSGWGVGEAFPAIAAQQPHYTYTQLANWKSGRRANSPLGLMENIAASLSERDMRAVADYLASLAPPPKQTANTAVNDTTASRP